MFASAFPFASGVGVGLGVIGLILRKPLEDGEGKGAGFSRSGLRAAEHIPACQGFGNGLGLNGGGSCIARGSDRAEDGLT